VISLALDLDIATWLTSMANQSSFVNGTLRKAYSEQALTTSESIDRRIIEVRNNANIGIQTLIKKKKELEGLNEL